MAKTGKKIAVGTAIAAAAGYVAGILTAPKSGKQTRADIKSAAVESITDAEKKLKKLHTQLATLLNDAKSRADDASGKAKRELDKLIETSQTVREKAREVLSAAHDGDVEDKDLKTAISSATEAVEALKTYLTKL